MFNLFFLKQYSYILTNCITIDLVMLCINLKFVYNKGEYKLIYNDILILYYSIFVPHVHNI